MIQPLLVVGIDQGVGLPSKGSQFDNLELKRNGKIKSAQQETQGLFVRVFYIGNLKQLQPEQNIYRRVLKRQLW